MVDNEAVSLSTNWNTLGDVDLRCILLENTSNGIEIDIEDMKTDNCVCLVNNKSNEKSKAQLEIKVKGYITDIVLISEAQVIEVFGVNDEYLLTHIADFFDDWEEMAVYYSKISVPNVPVCKLKFTRARNEDRLWIYGAKITQKMANHQPDNPVRFNLEQINRLIGSSNFADLKNENHFNNLLHFYFKNLPNNNFSFALGRKPGGNDALNPCETASDESPKSRENFLSEMLSRLHVQNSAESQKTFGEPCNSNLLLGYIDKKFHEIRKDILREVDAKIASLRDETNHKLDRIISLLENESQ